MDIGRAITYVFQDPAWLRKTLIGAVLLIIPIVGALFVAGYVLRTIRRVIEGTDSPLPEWDDFGGDLVRGLKVIVAILVWALPAIVIWFFALIPTAIADNNSTNGNAFTALAALVSLAANCLVILFGILVTFVQPLVLSRLALRESLADAFDFSAIIAEARANATKLLIVLVMQYVIGLVASLGIFVFVIGIVFTAFLSYLMLAHLYGQVRRQIVYPQMTTSRFEPPV